MPTSTLELAVRCENLANKDLLSKSDPFCVMFLKRDGSWFEFDRTETLLNNLSPTWLKKFIVTYSFEECQAVKFEVYDSDGDSRVLKSQDFLGRCEATLGSLVAASTKFVSVLKDGPKSNGGRMTIFSEERKENCDLLTLQLTAQKLDKKDLFGKSDPFFVVSKQTQNGQFSPVYESEVIKNSLDPSWDSFTKPVVEICNGDFDRKLKFDIYDHENDGTREFIGSFEATLNQLRIHHLERLTFSCHNPEKAKKSSYKNSGFVQVNGFHLRRPHTFVDYIKGGMSINFSVGIDFTASNRDPRDPQSLHFFGNSGDTQYSLAIKSVGEVIKDYDSDQMYPALGFGAQLPPRGDVSHCFFLNLRHDNPFCYGVNGLLEAYQNALTAVNLYGPTHFSPIIEHVANFARSYMDGKHYFILLIITDGIINDLEETKRSIVKASGYPMSIIIIGVGNEDFSAMEALDADKTVLRAGGQVAQRDIVQFVELRKYLRNSSWDNEMLAREVLREVPKQVVEWMEKKNIKPSIPPS